MDSPTYTKNSLEYFVTYDLAFGISNWIYTEFLATSKIQVQVLQFLNTAPTLTSGLESCHLTSFFLYYVSKSLIRESAARASAKAKQAGNDQDTDEFVT